jgi:hypothetical protein
LGRAFFFGGTAFLGAAAFFGTTAAFLGATFFDCGCAFFDTACAFFVAVFFKMIIVPAFLHPLPTIQVHPMPGVHFALVSLEQPVIV